MKGGIETPFATMHWFIGVVEDNKDPESLGRARVRCIGYHSEDKDAIPTESLPWAMVAQSAQFGTGIGWSPIAIAQGTWVVGWFADGEIAQQPIVVGTLPSKPASEGKQATSKGFADPDGTYPKYFDEPDTSRVARGVAEGTAYETTKGEVDDAIGEPNTPWAPKWPSNRVLETQSGHLLEFDDTPDAERVHLYHKSGSFVEFHPDGTVVARTKGSSYEIVFGEQKIHIKGNTTLIVDGNVTETIKGNVDQTISGTLSAKVTGNATVHSDGNAQVDASGNATLKAGGTATVEGGNTTVKGGSVKVEGQTTIDGQTTINGGSNVTVNAGTIKLNGAVDVG